jgi:TonB family protein
VAQAHPPRLPPQRAVARAAVNPAGTHAPAGQNAAGGASQANNGAAWMGKLKQWWDQHSFYPKEASQTNEGGNVKVHIVIAPDGQVTAIELVQGSGLTVLDAAALAAFRNAHLPPFSPGTPAQPADVVATLHYRPPESCRRAEPCRPVETCRLRRKSWTAVRHRPMLLPAAPLQRKARADLTKKGRILDAVVGRFICPCRSFCSDACGRRLRTRVVPGLQHYEPG